eukprot:evm.model.NODE_39448_length_22869_cov_24.273470.4
MCLADVLLTTILKPFPHFPLSLFTQVKAKAEPVKPTVEEEEDDEWGVTAKPTEQLYMGDRKAAELIVGAYSDVNLATKVAHDDTKYVF